MASVGSIVKWFFVVLFAFLLWIDLLVVSIAIPVQATLLDKQAWINAVEQFDWYESVEPLLVQTMAEEISSHVGAQVPAESLLPIIRESFSKEWLNGELKKLVSNYFDFIGGKSDRIDFFLSFQEPKQKLPQALSSALGSNPLSEPLIAALLDQFPDRLELGKETDWLESLEQQRAMVSLLNQVVLALIVIALVFAAFIAVLLRNHKIFLVLGIVLLLCGLFVLLLSQAISASVPQFSKEIDFQLQSGLRTQNSLGIEPVLLAIFKPISEKTLLFGIVEFIVGIGSLAGYWFLRQKKKTASASK